MPSSLPPSSPPSLSSHASFSHNNSDPFGFFAVETRLKAQRALLPHNTALRSRAPLTNAALNPHRLVAPLTPRKERMLYLPALSSIGDNESTRSSPSPSKPPARKGKGKAKATEDVVLGTRSRPLRQRQAKSVIDPPPRRVQPSRQAARKVSDEVKPKTARKKRGAVIETKPTRNTRRQKTETKVAEITNDAVDQEEVC